MTVRLGAGAGFSADRIDPAAALVAGADLDFLVFEVLGERTIAAANDRKLSGRGVGHDPLLADRLAATLPTALERHTRIVTNGGAADPLAAGRLADEIGGGRARVAVITGDDVLQAVREADPVVWENGLPLSEQPGELVSANAYVGAGPVRDALDAGADVVIGGRLADPSLYLGAIAHAHGWALDGDPELLGRGTVVGHLLECAGQLTGGYYADPVTKPVPRLAELGFPFADVAADGSAVLGKLEESGGLLTVRTATEQLLYEVGDPAAYLTPDVTADFSQVRLEQVGPDRVAVSGASGRPRPDALKVTLGFRGSWRGEGQITYAGPRALARAELARDIVVERLAAVHAIDAGSVTVELIGTGSAFRGLVPPQEALEVRLRVTGSVATEREARAVGWEVESLYTNGPAGGGGARTSTTEVLAIRSCLLPRELVHPTVTMVGGAR
ncbi:DUF1446 domain-containing protein [Ornithinimicrobium humiphilum]|uniref:Uncharacterized protein DUF1446 n=1 Tax=Ornithinimicrobium humiphilum TaxID=125288 RepID=A0A543KLE1_9MICO|nr:acyclic terpene utilization AtuA family protein [Ornithinimicrobium humiphilum]TQM95896.1 uncharacterized protein DUF1446 [Ornithinimicrobium humiphilum]